MPLSAVFCVLLTVFLPLAAAAEDAFNPPPPVIGYRLTFEGRIMGLDCTDWTLSEITPEGNLLSRCGDYVMENAKAHHYNVVRVTRTDGQVVAEFLPYAPALQFPLKTGARWSGDYSFYTMELNEPMKAKGECRVEALEPVKVPAGEVSAYRIECTDHLGLGSRRLRTQSTRWYAPELAAFVKGTNVQDPGRWNFALTGVGLGDTVGPLASAAAAAEEPVVPPEVSAMPSGGNLNEVAPVLDFDDY
jgi:hypothetical protein